MRTAITLSFFLLVFKGHTFYTFYGQERSLSETRAYAQLFYCFHKSARGAVTKSTSIQSDRGSLTSIEFTLRKRSTIYTHKILLIYKTGNMPRSTRIKISDHLLRNLRKSPFSAYSRAIENRSPRVSGELL